MTQKYQVLARRYRPQTFAQVVGQGSIVQTLRNAITLERTAHAYLFCGSRGTGKTTLARLFAKALNCSDLQEGCEPCNQCASCKEISSTHSMDVIEIDGASNRGIDDVRTINETVSYTPSCGQFKIYIIDEVHMLTKEAFNALLKTLEEPPPKVKFFFATTEPHKLPSTIISRCQRHDLRRIPHSIIFENLSKICSELDVEIEEEALHLIAKNANGGLRDAQSLLDQVIAFHTEKITAESIHQLLGSSSHDQFFKLDEASKHCKLSYVFDLSDELFHSGKNVLHFLEQLMQHYRVLLKVKLGSSFSPEQQLYSQQYLNASTLYSADQLIEILDKIAKTQEDLKWAPCAQTLTEILLLKIVRTRQTISIDYLMQKLALLQKTMSTSTTPPSPPPPPLSLPVQKTSTSPRPAKEPSHPASPSPRKKLPKQEQGKFDSLMQFTTVELGGQLKKI